MGTQIRLDTKLLNPDPSAAVMIQKRKKTFKIQTNIQKNILMAMTDEVKEGKENTLAIVETLNDFEKCYTSQYYFP